MVKRQYKKFSKAFKLEAIRLADEATKPVTQVARELGLRVNQIYKWRKQLEEKQDDAFSGKHAATDKDAEIRRMKKELAAKCCRERRLRLHPGVCVRVTNRHTIPTDWGSVAHGTVRPSGNRSTFRSRE